MKPKLSIFKKMIALSAFSFLTSTVFAIDLNSSSVNLANSLQEALSEGQMNTQNINTNSKYYSFISNIDSTDDNSNLSTNMVPWKISKEGVLSSTINIKNYYSNEKYNAIISVKTIDDFPFTIDVNKEGKANINNYEKIKHNLQSLEGSYLALNDNTIIQKFENGNTILSLNSRLITKQEYQQYLENKSSLETTTVSDKTIIQFTILALTLIGILGLSLCDSKKDNYYKNIPSKH